MSDAVRGGYWAILPADVLASPTLGDKAKLIYAEISRLVGPQGYCWARDKYLAERVGCSPKTVSRAIHDLAAAGLIRVEMSANHNGTERHIYAGLSPLGGMDTSDQTPQGGMDISDQTPMDKNDQTPHPTQYKVINKRETNTRACVRARGVALPKEVIEVFDLMGEGDPELRERLDAMAENRAAIKKPYKTARAAKLLCSKLISIADKYGRAVMLSCLDEAIERGWQTVYEPKRGELPTGVAGKVQEAVGAKMWTPEEG